MRSLAPYVGAVQNIDLNGQPILVRREHWAAPDSDERIEADLRALFTDDTITITRGDVRADASSGALRPFVLKALAWGYPQGTSAGRGLGGHMRTRLGRLDEISVVMGELIAAGDLDWPSLSGHIRELRGLGGIRISTYSKLLSLGGVTVDGLPCLILDTHLAGAWLSPPFVEMEAVSSEVGLPLRPVVREYADEQARGQHDRQRREAYLSKLAAAYPDYLRAMVSLADRVGLDPDGGAERLEAFLFSLNQTRSKRPRRTFEEQVEEALRRLQVGSADLAPRLPH